jgi:hypothetical protein
MMTIKEWADDLATKNTDGIAETITNLTEDIQECQTRLTSKNSELDSAKAVLTERLTEIRDSFLSPPKASGSEPEAPSINMIES